MSKSKVLVILTGSIAAYKVGHVLSQLTQKNCDVQVIATSSALKFLGEATIEGLTGRKVHTDLFEGGTMMGHIQWQRWADLILVAPATANFINKMSLGLADDLASTLFLAHDFKKPFLLAPAMNTKMYFHTITQKSIHSLQEMGVEVLESASGVLACGEEGYGRLLEPELIVEEVLKRLAAPSITTKTKKPSLVANSSLRILITAGGTKERIDDVRSLTNSSTGRTGFQLAQAFHNYGFQVHLLLSENSHYAHEKTDFTVDHFSDFTSLQNLLKKELGSTSYDLIFHAAAVSDYKVETVLVNNELALTGKIPSQQKIQIQLTPYPKIIDQLKSFSKNSHTKVIGFKLTSGSNPASAKEAVQDLIQHSKCDFVVHNDLQSITATSHSFNIFNSSAQSFYCANVHELADYFAHTSLSPAKELSL